MINKIELVLAKNYVLTDEEIDYIINFGKKFLMFKEIEEEE